MKVLLPNERFANSQDKKVVKKINLENDFIDLNNDSQLQEIDMGEFFQYEREKSKTYKIYGKIDFSSILNNLKLNYFDKNDFFMRYSTLPSKTILNSFDVYLLKKSKEYLTLGDNFIYTHEVVATPDQIDIYPCSFSKNIFFEQIYFYNINFDLDVEDDHDFFNKNITEFQLFFVYKNPNPAKKENLYSKLFKVENTDYTFSKVEITDKKYVKGDKVYGHLFEYPKNSFDENIINEQIYYINMLYNNNDTIVFKYNPFIDIKIREYSDNLKFSNIKMKSIIDIPSYAKKIDDNGNYIWRDILEYSFIDPITDKGFDFPFLNGKHYVYNNIVLNIVPDMENQTTSEFFKEIKINSFNTDLFKINPLKIVDKC